MPYDNVDRETVRKLVKVVQDLEQRVCKLEKVEYKDDDSLSQTLNPKEGVKFK